MTVYCAFRQLQLCKQVNASQQTSRQVASQSLGMHAGVIRHQPFTCNGYTAFHGKPISIVLIVCSSNIPSKHHSSQNSMTPARPPARYLSPHNNTENTLHRHRFPRFGQTSMPLSAVARKKRAKTFSIPPRRNWGAGHRLCVPRRPSWTRLLRRRRGLRLVGP